VVVAETGFDAARYTSAVEGIETGAGRDYLEKIFLPSLGQTLPPDAGKAGNYDQPVKLDLVQLIGASRLKRLLSQGKLNVALAGSIAYAGSTGLTANRSRGSANAVHGPEFWIKGDYVTQLCQVPDDPNSPMNDVSGAIPDVSDTASPVISSLSAQEMTSTSAVIQWLTDERADSRVCYGIGNTDTCTPFFDTDPNWVTFHRVSLTGLAPYKAYQFKVITRDASPNRNESVSGVRSFQTLR
jgi:hypothetical protein